MRAIRNISLCVIAVGSVACSGSDDKKVDIGNRDVAVVGEKLSDFAGSWDGYAEAFELEPGSDRVRVTLNAEGEGTVLFGDSELSPMSTDPLARYPAKERSLQPRSDNMGLSEGEPGFEYPIHAMSFSAKRLRFQLNPTDLIDPWCQQEPSEPSESGGFRCFGDRRSMVDWDSQTGAYSIGGQPISAESLATMQYCQMVCDCTASGCTGRVSTPSQFDGTLESDGAEFVGTLAFPHTSEPRGVTLRLSRQSE